VEKDMQTSLKGIAEQAKKDKGRRFTNGIAGNSEGIRQFSDGVMRIWYRWLNRRSQHRSYTWNGFKEMTKSYEIPRPKVVEQWWIKPSVQYSLKFV
jgi:hypothetical protein